VTTIGTEAETSDRVGEVTAAADVDVHSVRNTASRPRLVRETPIPMAECPRCGVRLALGAEGARWTVRSPRDVANRLILELGSLEREELVVLLLNTKNIVVGQHTVYRGNVSASLVRVGELFTEAVRAGVPRVILAHNHPSGDPTPSPDDLHLTASAMAAGRLLDIDLLDHIVIAGGSYVSLRDRGITFDTPGPGRETSAESR
jgi:DNA repair protein RadC